VQDAAPFVKLDIKRVISIIRRVKIEEDPADALHAVHILAERADLVLVAVVDRVIDEERRMF